MRMSPFSKVGMSPSGRVGDMNGRGDFGDEFGGARTAGGDWAGREQGFAAGAGSGAAGALRSAGETACSGLSRTGRRRSGFAPAGADVESSFGRRRDGPGEGLSSGQVQGFRPDGSWRNWKGSRSRARRFGGFRSNSGFGNRSGGVISGCFNCASGVRALVN